MPRSKSILRLRLRLGRSRSRSSVWSCLSAYVAYQLRSEFQVGFFGLGSGSALAWGTGSGSGWGSPLRRCAEPAPKIASDFESMMLLLKMMSMSQCRWHLSPRKNTRAESSVGAAAVADKAIVIVNRISIWLNLIRLFCFSCGCFALSVHVRFSTYFPCHFRAQKLARRFRELSFILRQEFANIYLFLYRILVSRASWNAQILLSIIIFNFPRFFCSTRDENLRQFGMKFARNEYPSSGGNTSIWHVHSFTTNRKRS